MVNQQGAHMRESDAFSWYMERDPLLRSTVVSVLLFDRCPDPMILLDKAERASRIVPGLRHKIVEAPLRLAPPRWTVDPDFDLSWHVRHVEAPAPKTLAAVLDLARVTGMAGFDRARPLWEWTLAEGLDGGQAAIVLKIHHSLTDGIGGMQLAATLFDLEPTGLNREPMPDAPAPEYISTPGMIADAFNYNVQRFYGMARHRASSAFSDAETRPAIPSIPRGRRSTPSARSRGPCVL